MSDLKKVYVASGPGDAHLLRGLLESEGIDAVIRGDDFVPLQGGGLFNIETRPSIWVLDDDQFARACEIASEYVHRSARTDALAGQSTGETWSCQSCGEPIERQFTACWKCGHDRSS